MLCQALFPFSRLSHPTTLGIVTVEDSVITHFIQEGASAQRSQGRSREQSSWTQEGCLPFRGPALPLLSPSGKCFKTVAPNAVFSDSFGGGKHNVLLLLCLVFALRLRHCPLPPVIGVDSRARSGSRVLSAFAGTGLLLGLAREFCTLPPPPPVSFLLMPWGGIFRGLWTQDGHLSP